jgi:hypothetical protein
MDAYATDGVDSMNAAIKRDVEFLSGLHECTSAFLLPDA